jgi:hypothetical protein
MPAPGAADQTTRAVIDANLYLVLATADGTGRPSSPPQQTPSFSTRPVCFSGHDR